MKKRLTSFVILAIILFALVGCGNKNEKKLPNLFDKNQTEIEEVLKDKGIVTTIDFIEYYSPSLEEGKFVKYGDDLIVGDTFKLGEVLKIYVASSKIRLPNFSGVSKDDMEKELLNRGVPKNRIIFLPQVGHDQYNTTHQGFLRYEDHSPGQYINPSEERISIVYDSRQFPPDLTGLNKYEIKKRLFEFKDVKFEYAVDNTKELDTFKEYKGFDGEKLVRLDEPLTVVLYDNDDINKPGEIVNPDQIFLSKYIDISKTEKGLELYNPGENDVNLEDYYIAILEDMSTQPTKRIDLSGTLPGKSTYVIMMEGCEGELKDKADLISSELFFDGNDVIQLRQTRNDTYIDSIYDIGNFDITFVDEIFIRIDDVTTSTRDFILTDWAGFIPEHIEAIGVHPYEILDGPTFELIPDKTFQEFGMTKVELTKEGPHGDGIVDGDTIYVRSLDPRDTTSYGGDQRLRFLMVDTPETDKPGVTGEPYAEAARIFTKNMLESASEIYIQSSRADGIRDTYGRHLALIWCNVGTESNPDWKLLNYELLKHGLGESAGAKNTSSYKNQPIFGNRYLYQWVQYAMNHARKNKLGIFSGVYKR